jgi:hypothetical protein
VVVSRAFGQSLPADQRFQRPIIEDQLPQSRDTVSVGFWSNALRRSRGKRVEARVDPDVSLELSLTPAAVRANDQVLKNTLRRIP